MKLSRKMKLALGLSLGAIVTTAAVTTMAVSCSDSNSSDSNSSGSNIVTSSNYNPTPELAKKITQADIDRMNVNLQDDVDESKKGLESEGATDVVATGIVKLEGDVLSQVMSSWCTVGKSKQTTVFTIAYKLTKISDNKYLMKESTVVTIDGKQVSSDEGIKPEQYITLAELTRMINNLYNNTSN